MMGDGICPHNSPVFDKNWRNFGLSIPKVGGLLDEHKCMEWKNEFAQDSSL
jgi:hypothetical protein